MLDCLKLDEGVYLVTYEDNTVKIVSPKDVAEIEILEKQAKLGEMDRDIEMCNYLKEEVKSIEFKNFLKSLLPLSISIFDAYTIPPNGELTGLGLLELMLVFYTIVNTSKLGNRLLEDSSLIPFIKMEEELQEKLEKQKSEIDKLTNEVRKTPKKRRVEDFIYTYSDLNCNDMMKVKQERQLLLK